MPAATGDFFSGVSRFTGAAEKVGKTSGRPVAICGVNKVLAGGTIAVSDASTTGTSGSAAATLSSVAAAEFAGAISAAVVRPGRFVPSFEPGAGAFGAAFPAARIGTAASPPAARPAGATGSVFAGGGDETPGGMLGTGK
ncbi:MAG TPA: hypothetical protein VFV81_09690, partial [Verrucomicrobiae bacterium]|nr:hypothetical protein [Verrucomicrobiae bacterium]